LQPPRRRKRKVDEDTVLDRLKRAESLLSQHGLQVNRSVEDETREDDEADEDDVDELPHKSRSVDPSHLTTAENIPSRPAHERFEILPLVTSVASDSFGIVTLVLNGSHIRSKWVVNAV
jgi:hypothetical protein